MLTTILNQNEFISNYILELNLPYSSAIKNHMVNLISGIIVTEGNKTISLAYNKLTSNRHRSTGSRFLSSYSWNHEYVTEEGIFHAISEISNTCDDNDVGFLIIDDTLSKKNTSTKKIGSTQKCVLDSIKLSRHVYYILKKFLLHNTLYSL